MANRGRPARFKEKARLQCHVEKADKDLLFSYFDEYSISYCRILSKSISKCAEVLRSCGYDPNSDNNDLEAIGECVRLNFDTDMYVTHIVIRGLDIP
jgi:hypothetical protein